MKNLIFGLILTVVSITGLTGFVNTSVAAESSVISTVTEYRYEYRKLNDNWTLKLTYRVSDNRLMNIELEHTDN